MPIFSGSCVALVTPFTERDTVDEAAVKRLVDWHISSGTSALIPCGTTGESATFTHDEQERMIRLVVEHSNHRIPVIAGAGSNSTREAVMLAQAAERAGANGILTITPYYNRPTQEGLFQHFKAVREATTLPLVLYNVPCRTGVNLSAETALRVGQLGGIAAVKEASGDLAQAQEILNGGLDILSGEDGLSWPLMAIGACGVIGVVANFAPAMVAAMCAAAASGDLQRARDYHRQVFALAKLAFCETNPIPAKTAVSELGMCRASFRLPLVAMTPDNHQRLIAGMKAHGLL